jgi:uncharacterized membrane protein
MLLVLVCLLGAIGYFVFFTRQGRDYVLDHPANFILIAGVALVGGLLSVAFQRMRQADRNRYHLFLRSGLVVAYAALLVLFLFRSAPWPSVVLCVVLFGYSVLLLCLTWKGPR